MTKHAPTSVELETAVIGVLSESETEMTAKEVRSSLMKEKPGWKVPAERRVAKFVKRQNARVVKTKEVNGGNSNNKNGLLGRFFKGDRTSNYSHSTHSYNLQKQSHESHLGNSSSENPQVSARKGFRRASVSMLRALSPTAKNKNTNQAIPTKSTTDLFRKSKIGMKGAPISYKQAEAERTASNHPIDTSKLMETETVIENVNELEQIKASAKGKSREKEQVPVKRTPTNDIAEAYLDDNDFKKKCCECNACILL